MWSSDQVSGKPDTLGGSATSVRGFARKTMAGGAGVTTVSLNGGMTNAIWRGPGNTAAAGNTVAAAGGTSIFVKVGRMGKG
ncbi:hypothetical protein QP164_15455 [Sphingomonas sp. LR59]|uniref:hypothetical protein n=1 Tax=Sphingomonas sp. LR59 TaxID=3050232 RepID=UPI002FE34D4E